MFSGRQLGQDVKTLKNKAVTQFVRRMVQVPSLRKFVQTALSANTHGCWMWSSSSHSYVFRYNIPWHSFLWVDKQCISRNCASINVESLCHKIYSSSCNCDTISAWMCWSCSELLQNLRHMFRSTNQNCAIIFPFISFS